MSESTVQKVKRPTDIVRLFNSGDQPFKGRFDGAEYPLEGPILPGQSKLLQRFIADHLTKQFIQRSADGSTIEKRFLEVRELEEGELSKPDEPSRLGQLLDQVNSLQAQVKTLADEKLQIVSAIEIMKEETDKIIQSRDALIADLNAKVSELSGDEGESSGKKKAVKKDK